MASALISLAANATALILLYFSITPRVEPLALRYNIFFGIDLIGPWWHVFLYPLIGLGIILVNFTVSYLTYLKEKLISIFFALAGAIVQLLILFYAVLIILLNR